MTMEWLLIPVFLLCALIMKIFIKAVDRFIADVIIPENGIREVSKEEQKTEESKKAERKTYKKSSTATMGKASIATETESDVPENAAFNALTFSGLLDKFRQRSNVGHDKDANTIEIGTARPMEVRIKHYEQP